MSVSIADHGIVMHYAVVSYANTHTRSALAGYSVDGRCKFNVFFPPMKSVELMNLQDEANVIGRMVHDLSQRECNELGMSFI